MDVGETTYSTLTNEYVCVGQKHLQKKERTKVTEKKNGIFLESELEKKEERALRITKKLLRVYGGCLGAKCRRRTWVTAKSLGEL